MRYLLDVWCKPRLQLTAVDEITMTLEVMVFFLVVAIIKVCVIDELRVK
jgi:hypothetical protein